MKNELKLSPTIIKRFCFTRKPFAILESRIYTLERESSHLNGNYWEYINRQYPLFESDELIIFRNEFFKENETEIRDYMNWIINFKLTRKLEDLANQVSDKIDYYLQLKEHSLDKFILDVFNVFCHKTDNRDKTDKEDVIDIDTKMESYPSIEDLNSIESVIYNIISRPGIISIGERCYQLNEDNAPSNGNGLLYFKGRKFKLIPSMSLEELAREYEIQLRGEIEKVALRHGNKFSKQITELNSKVKEYDTKINRTISERATKKIGNIGYEPLEGNEYLIYAEIEPFLIEKDKKYYVFNEEGKEGSKRIKVGTVLNIDSNYLSIEGPPIILNMPYFHPFVYDDGEICYENSERWIYYGIKFSPYKYKINQPNLARKVASLLWEASENITQGYLGDTLSPLHYIFRFTPIAHNLRDAKAYARSHRISEKRIFKN